MKRDEPGALSNKPSPKYLTIGTFRMPYEDWAYSNTANLLIVAQTYLDIKGRIGFDGKVGDLCAEICRIFRYLAGLDLTKEDYESIASKTSGAVTAKLVEGSEDDQK